MLKHKFFTGLLLAGILMTAAAGTTVTRKSKDIKDADRLQSRKIYGIFEMRGQGKDANWGISAEADFSYKVRTCIISKIVEKKIGSNGRIHVVEERTFEEYAEDLEINPAVRFDFSTLPVDEFRDAVRVGSGLISLVNGNPSAVVIAEGINAGVKLIKDNFDGKKLDLSPEQAKHIKDVLSKRAGRHFIKIRPVEGQTYRITYTQNRKGRPLSVKFEKTNGEKMTDEEEKILKQANAFINYDVLPETNKRVGGTWIVDAQDMEETFDPFLGGHITGYVKFVRNANDKNKNWNIRMYPNTLLIKNDNYSKIGTIELTQGSAVVEPKKFHNVINLSTKGKIKTDEVSTHHMLFKAKISSWCDFEARMVSEIME